MTAKRRCIPNFEARSVVLFTACALGAALGAHAQTHGQTTDSPAHGLNPQIAQAVMGPGTAKPADKAAPMAAQGAAGVEAAAFARADKDRDGRLSRAESEQLPMVQQRFDQIDVNKDNFLSREEFDKGTRS
jgi:EF hand